MAEAALSLSEQKVSDQASLLELARRDNQELVKTYDSQVSRERADHSTQKVTLFDDICCLVCAR